MTKQKIENVIMKSYKIEPYVITGDNLCNFEIIPNRRLISDGHVSKIHGVLQNGKNPIGILIVNRRQGKIRLIDGNHRFEAIKRYISIKRGQMVKIECTLKVYEDLTDEEERQIYSEEAMRRNESAEDRLNMYKDTIQFWKALQDPVNMFPCKVTIYPSRNALKFRVLIDALRTAEESSEGVYVPATFGKNRLIEYAQSIQYDNFLQMKDFVKFFISIFGEVSEDNVYTKYHLFLPLFDIYCKNKDKIDSIETLRKRFAKIINKSDILQFVTSASREINIKLHETMLGYMNFGISPTSPHRFI